MAVEAFLSTRSNSKGTKVESDPYYDGVSTIYSIKKIGYYVLSEVYSSYKKRIS